MYDNAKNSWYIKITGAGPRILTSGRKTALKYMLTSRDLVAIVIKVMTHNSFVTQFYCDYTLLGTYLLPLVVCSGW